MSSPPSADCWPNSACTTISDALPGARVDLWHCDADGRYSGVQDAREDRRRRNAADPIFRRGGDELLLAPLPAAEGLEASRGYGRNV